MVGVDALERPHLERTPMGRWGTPDDVAPAVLFLASGAARFITGQTVCVDGGYSAT
jgi:NAD(P)-dependent dehydrogenase (short-subunit alcohol dehydrogenase family)